VMFTLPPASISPSASTFCGNTGFCACVQTSIFCGGMGLGQLPETPPPRNTIELRLDNNIITDIRSLILVNGLQELYLDSNQLTGLPVPAKPLPSLVFISIKVRGLLLVFPNFQPTSFGRKIVLLRWATLSWRALAQPFLKFFWTTIPLQPLAITL
jgi:hypothetical protein